MFNHPGPIHHPLAIAGLFGVGAVIGARLVLPIVHRRAAGGAEHWPLLSTCPDEELDRWMNEGGCCAIAAPHT